MPAEVIPFPLARRLDLITKQAEHALTMTPAKAEQHIARQLVCQQSAMRRRGVDEAVIAQELRSMDAAIRAAMWTAVFNAPGGAR